MRCLAVYFLAICSSFLCAQISAPPPDALLDAGHCLAADHRDWLDVASEKPYEVELGLVSADKSEAGKSEAGRETPVYVIEFTTTTHTEGFAFAFVSRGKDSHHRELLFQSRTKFHQSDDGSQQVNLLDAPLGGVGSQDDILAAIRQIGFHTWKVPVANLRNYSGSTHCDMSEAVM